MEFKNTIAQHIRKRIHWIPLLVMVAWTITPLIWGFAASFKGITEIYRFPPRLLPESFYLNNYVTVLQSRNFSRYVFNSFFLAATSTLIVLIVSVMAGYGFARYRFKLSHILLLAILIPRIIPRSSLIVPLFNSIAALGLLNTYAALIITYTATAIPIATWVFSGFFKLVPRALEEAARIDGTNFVQMVWHVLMPISLPAFITISVFTFREGWNEFPFALAFTTSARMRTLPFQLYMLQETFAMKDWPVVLAFTMITIFPVLLLYLVFQSRVVSGITQGALKG